VLKLINRHYYTNWAQSGDLSKLHHKNWWHIWHTNYKGNLPFPS